MTQPIRFEVARESRTDHATRVIDLMENAPRYSYERAGSYRKPANRTVTWEVSQVRMSWNQGVLKRVDVLGFRLRKDGTVGVVRENAYFWPMPDAPTRFTAYLGRAAEVTEWDWLNTLIAEHSTPPPFDAK